MKILIVDDSALIRTILKDIIEKESDLFVVGEASNGKRAVEMNLEIKPDFIIMDIEMPIMDGLEATRRIMRERPVPIMIFSNEINAENSFEAVNSGAVEVMRKPGMGNLHGSDFFKHFIGIRKAT